MSTNESNPLCNDASLIPAVAGLAPVVAGSAGNLGWANGPATPGEPAGTASIMTYLHALRRHWLVAMALGIVCGGVLGFVVWLARPAQYAATALLQVKANDTPIVFDLQARSGMGGRDLFDIYRETQMGLLKDSYVISAALGTPEIAALPSIRRNEPDAVGWLGNELSVTFPKGELMYVSLIGEDKDEVTKLVNAVVDTYLAKVVDREHEDRVGHCNKLDDLREKETEVRGLLNNLRQLAEQAGGTEDEKALSIRQQVLVSQYAEYRRELVRVQFEKMHAISELKTAQALLANADEVEPTAYEVNEVAWRDPQAQQLIGRLTSYRLIVEDLKRTMVPGSKMGAAKRQMMEAEMLQQQYDQLGKEIRGQLKERKRAEAEREVKKLETQVQLLTEQEQHFQDDVEKQGREVLHVGQKSIEIEMDKDKLRNLNEVLASIAGEREKLKVELNSTPRIVRLQKAESPKEEYKRAMRMLLIGVSSLFGFCLPVFGVVLWDVRSRRVNAVEEVAQGLGLSVIGSVPVIPAQILRRLGGTSRRARTWRLRLTESIDGIAARLLRKAEMEQARVVLVSSAVAGEGKTTLATQLAKSLARHCRRTVLVDFDLRQPALDEVFGVPLEPGVCEALRGNANVNGMVHPTGTEHLSVLSAGQCDRQTMAALANGGGSRLFNQLREKYDFVIIDSSPILPVADTRFVSQYADTVVLSVFRDLSEVPKIQAACEILDAFGVRHLEAVVTGGSGFSYGRGRQYATSGTV